MPILDPAFPADNNTVLTIPRQTDAQVYLAEQQRILQQRLQETGNNENHLHASLECAENCAPYLYRVGHEDRLLSFELLPRLTRLYAMASITGVSPSLSWIRRALTSDCAFHAGTSRNEDPTGLGPSVATIAAAWEEVGFQGREQPYPVFYGLWALASWSTGTVELLTAWADRSLVSAAALELLYPGVMRLLGGPVVAHTAVDELSVLLHVVWTQQLGFRAFHESETEAATDRWMCWLTARELVSRLHSIPLAQIELPLQIVPTAQLSQSIGRAAEWARRTTAELNNRSTQLPYAQRLRSLAGLSAGNPGPVFRIMAAAYDLDPLAPGERTIVSKLLYQEATHVEAVALARLNQLLDPECGAVLKTMVVAARNGELHAQRMGTYADGTQRFPHWLSLCRMVGWMAQSTTGWLPTVSATEQAIHEDLRRVHAGINPGEHAPTPLPQRVTQAAGMLLEAWRSHGPGSTQPVTETNISRLPQTFVTEPEPEPEPEDALIQRVAASLSSSLQPASVPGSNTAAEPSQIFVGVSSTPEETEFWARVQPFVQQRLSPNTQPPDSNRTVRMVSLEDMLQLSLQVSDPAQRERLRLPLLVHAGSHRLIGSHITLMWDDRLLREAISCLCGNRIRWDGISGLSINGRSFDNPQLSPERRLTELGVPDYCESLDAMRQARKTCPAFLGIQTVYWRRVYSLPGRGHEGDTLREVSARQQAHVFVEMLQDVLRRALTIEPVAPQPDVAPIGQALRHIPS